MSTAPSFIHEKPPIVLGNGLKLRKCKRCGAEGMLVKWCPACREIVLHVQSRRAAKKQAAKRKAARQAKQ